VLYNEYYDLQEKGLKMRAKKKIKGLMIGMRAKKHNQKSFKGEEREEEEEEKKKEK